MSLETIEHNRRESSLLDECKLYLSYHIVLTLKDGNSFDGIIDDVRGDTVIVLVGEDVLEESNEMQRYGERQPFGFGPPRRRFRRFRRRPFPLNAIATLALLQYPFLVPPFPY